LLKNKFNGSGLKWCRKYVTDEFKNDAIKLVTEQGYSCNQVAQRLGINHSNVSRWVRQYRRQSEQALKGSGSIEELTSENRRLKKENKRLWMEREILKKAAAFFANESD
jgi:transposase